MEKPLTLHERKLLQAVQYGLPLSSTPYQDLAETLGTPVEQLLSTLRQWKADGRIRRAGAIVNHFQMGHGAGAMVVWQVPAERVDEVGKLFASEAPVSHAYARPARPHWPYNLYTMVHAADDDQLRQTIEAMSRQSGIREFRQLKTVRELKKVPPTYIVEH